MTESIPPGLMKIVRQVLEKQVENSDPPAASSALHRLLSKGMSEDEAWRQLGTVLLSELEYAKKEGQPLDRGTYVRALNMLPAVRIR